MKLYLLGILIDVESEYLGIYNLRMILFLLFKCNCLMLKFNLEEILNLINIYSFIFRNNYVRFLVKYILLNYSVNGNFIFCFIV